jgi:hypothetical protein
VALADGFWGLVPVTAPLMLGRDALFAAERVVYGAPTASDAFVWASLLVPIVMVAGKRVRAPLQMGRVLVAMHRIRGAQFANLTRWLMAAGTRPKFARRFEKIIELLADHGDEVANATIEILQHTEVGWRHMVYLERTLQAAGSAAPDVVRLLQQTLVNHGADVLRTSISVTRTADQVTPKVVSASVKLARGLEAAKAVALQTGKKLSIPRAARLNTWVRNFPGPPETRRVSEILEDLDDIVDSSTEGVRFIVTQLGVVRKQSVFVPDATEAVIRYAKSTGKKVRAFERRLDVPNPQAKPWLKQYARQYDVSYVIDEDVIDVDVKNWTRFFPGYREGHKFQKDIVAKFVADGNLDSLRWAFPKAILGNTSRQTIENWMLRQLNGSLVRSRLSAAQLTQARARLQQAVKKDLIEFF